MRTKFKRTLNRLRIARPRTSQRSASVSPPSAPVTTATIRFAIAKSATIIDTTKVGARTTCITQHCRTYRRWIHRRRPTWSRRLSGETLSLPNFLVPYLLRHPVSLNVRKMSGQGWGLWLGQKTLTVVVICTSLMGRCRD